MRPFEILPDFSLDLMDKHLLPILDSVDVSIVVGVFVLWCEDTLDLVHMI